MCFHIKQTKSATEVENRFQAKVENPDLFQKNDNINGFNFPLVAVIKNEQPSIISHAHWGLIPSWAPNEDIRKLTLNAKIETLDAKPAFKPSISKRCLMLANGFYEWQWRDKSGKQKIKYEIGLKDEALFAFAGIYAQWTHPISGKIVETVAMLTTEANPTMAEIHNTKRRMPVILKKEDEMVWLQNEDYKKFALPYTVDLFARSMEPSAIQTTLF